jgi:redox-sensitive bicupin YhaK (pirin superfamily)
MHCLHLAWTFDGPSYSWSRFDAVMFDQEGDSLEALVLADANKLRRFILFVGEPLDWKIIEYGPFCGIKRKGGVQSNVKFLT